MGNNNTIIKDLYKILYKLPEFKKLVTNYRALKIENEILKKENNIKLEIEDFDKNISGLKNKIILDNIKQNKSSNYNQTCHLDMDRDAEYEYEYESVDALDKMHYMLESKT